MMFVFVEMVVDIQSDEPKSSVELLIVRGKWMNIRWLLGMTM